MDGEVQPDPEQPAVAAGEPVGEMAMLAGTPHTAGRVRFFGPLAVCIATAAINVNAQVMADNGTAGYVKTYASSAVVLGIALTPAGAAGDQILVMLSAGQDAV